jgi:uncharacterized alpha-E superfamily protein
LIVLSAVFPRSIRFAIEQVDESLARIAAFRFFDPEYGAGDGHLPPTPLPIGTDPSTGSGQAAARTAGRLHSRLAYGTIDEVLAMGVGPYLQDVQQRCIQIGEHVHAQYFAPRILRPEEVVA